MVVWNKKSPAEAVAAGRKPDKVNPRAFLVDSLIEIKPTGQATGAVVWEWRLWDHLVQDHDPSKANYGNVADHPELVDINFGEDAVGLIARGPAAWRRSGRSATWEAIFRASAAHQPGLVPLQRCRL